MSTQPRGAKFLPGTGGGGMPRSPWTPPQLNNTGNTTLFTAVNTAVSNMVNTAKNMVNTTVFTTPQCCVEHHGEHRVSWTLQWLWKPHIVENHGDCEPRCLASVEHHTTVTLNTVCQSNSGVTLNTTSVEHSGWTQRSPQSLSVKHRREHRNVHNTTGKYNLRLKYYRFFTPIPWGYP